MFLRYLGRGAFLFPYFLILFLHFPKFLICSVFAALPLLFAFLLSDRSVARVIRREFGDDGSRFFHLYEILKKNNGGALTDFETGLIVKRILRSAPRKTVPDIFFRFLYSGIILFLIIPFFGGTSRDRALFSVKEREVLYNAYLKRPVSVFVRTYGETVRISMVRAGRVIKKADIKDGPLWLESPEDGDITLSSEDMSVDVPVKVIGPAGISLNLRTEAGTLRAGEGVLEGEEISYDCRIDASCDTFVMALTGAESVPLSDLSGKFRALAPCTFSVHAYISGELVGALERHIPVEKNAAPKVFITSPAADEELDAFFGEFRFAFEAEDDNGLKRLSLVLENEGGLRGKSYDFNAGGKKHFSKEKIVRLEDLAGFEDRVLYFHAEAEDMHGLIGISRQFAFTLFGKDSLKEIFDDLSGEIFGELENSKNLFSREESEGSAFSPVPEKERTEALKNAEKAVESVEKTMEYLEAQMEDLKLENSILENYRRQMELISELLDKEVLELLQKKMQGSLDRNGQSGQLRREDLDKIAFELERIVKKLEEYKKGVDAKKIADRLEKTGPGDEKDLDEVSDMASDLFSKFNEDDEKVLPKEKTLSDMKELREEKDPGSFNKKKIPLKESFEKYAETKMRGQQQDELDASELLNAAFSIDLAKDSFPENNAFLLKGLEGLEKELLKNFSVILMLDYSLYRRFRSALDHFKNYDLNKNAGEFVFFRNNYSYFMEDLLSTLEKLSMSSCSGSCPSIFEKLNQMSKDQGQLNSFLDKLMEELKKNGLNQKLSQSLERAASRQGEIKEALERLGEEMQAAKERGELSRGDAGEVLKEMEELEEKLREAGGYDPGLTEKGRHIEVKLLEMQRAMYKRKDDNYRFSVMGRFIQKWYPSISSKLKGGKRTPNDLDSLIRDYKEQ